MYQYLALGDSYTIGESVVIHENFPYQVVQLLRKKGVEIAAPEIVAVTGFTSFELLQLLSTTTLNEPYQFVTLLIGVNNQYRGLPMEDFEKDCEELIHKAIAFTNGNAKAVLVLSIPDWGNSTFGLTSGRENISKEIDEMNVVIRNVCIKNNVHCIDITESSRKAKNNPSLLAKDGLHYSAIEHRNWAEKVAQYFIDAVYK